MGPLSWGCWAWWSFVWLLVEEDLPGGGVDDGDVEVLDEDSDVGPADTTVQD